MIKYEEVKNISLEMMDNLDTFENSVSKFMVKTTNYDATIGDDISANIKAVVEEISGEIKELKEQVKEKMQVTEAFATKLGETERKRTDKISKIR